MKSKIFLTLILTSIFITLSCKESITNPEPQPGRRDYVWDVDTLNAPFNFFSSLWGAAPNDIWTVGSGGSDYLWHFDGSDWSSYKKEIIVSGGNAITGFARNNIWMVSNEGYIWHYDGNSWKVNFIYKQNDGFASIMDIWGRNNSDIYACGVINLQSKREQRGFILHYDGVKWEEYYKADYISQFNSILGDDKNILMSGVKIIFEANNFVRIDSVYINSLNDKKFNRIYSHKNDAHFSLTKVGDKLHCVIENSLFKFSSGTLEHIMDINESNFTSNVFGRNYKDLFLNMLDGICHYNGTDIEYLYKFDQGISYYVGKPLDFGNELFFNISPTRKLHGKLK